MVKAGIDAPSVRPDGLQLDEHRHFQEKFWIAERCAWVGFGVLLFAAVLGLTGSGGVFSHDTVTAPGGEIEFARISRWQAEDTLSVTFSPGGGERGLTLAPDFARHFQIEDIQPAPDRSEAHAEGQRLIFMVAPDGPATVTLHVRAQKPGLARYRASIDEAAPRELSTLILP